MYCHSNIDLYFYMLVSFTNSDLTVIFEEMFLVFHKNADPYSCSSFPFFVLRYCLYNFHGFLVPSLLKAIHDCIVSFVQFRSYCRRCSLLDKSLVTKQKFGLCLLHVHNSNYNNNNTLLGSRNYLCTCIGLKEI